MMFLANLLRVVLALFFIRLLLRGVAAWLRPAAAPEAPRRAGATDLVRDRVCNTYLPRDRALLAKVAGKDEHFCSATCRDRALTAAGLAS